MDIVAPDGGWGWVVAIGAAVVQMQVATIAQNFGVYFAHLTSSGSLPSSLVSAIPSVISFIMFFFCPISTALSKYYGARNVATVGSIMLTSSVAISSIVDNFYWFLIFFSLFGGVGAGLVLVQGNICVQQYFHKRRSTANGIFMSGGSLGTILMPILLRHTLARFGLQITLLIHAACMSSTILAAFTFRPLTKKGQKTEKLPETKSAFKIKVKMDNKNPRDDESNTFEIQKESSKTLNTQNDGHVFCGVWFPKLRQIFVWTVLKNPLFLILTFSVVTGRTATRGFGMMVPAFGESIGLGKENSTYLITIMATSDFISRLSFPIIIDFFFPNVAKKYFFMFFSVTMAISTLSFGLIVSDLISAMVFSIVFGIGIGGLASFMNVIYAEVLGVDMVQDTIPLMYLMTGVWTLPVLPVLGALRDVTGSFQASFFLLSGSLVCGTLIWSLEPRFSKKDSPNDGDTKDC